MFFRWNKVWLFPLDWKIDALNMQKVSINDLSLSIIKLVSLTGNRLHFFRQDLHRDCFGQVLLMCGNASLFVPSIFSVTFTENIAMRLHFLFYFSHKVFSLTAKFSERKEILWLLSGVVFYLNKKSPVSELKAVKHTSISSKKHSSTA